MFPMPSSTQLYVFLIATVLQATLSGCQMLPSAQQTVIPPTDVSGQECVARCDLPYSQCEQRQQLREAQCQQDFKRISDDHAACIAAKGRQCLQPVPCLGEDRGICTTQREECVLACGGQVEAHRSIWPWKDRGASQPAPDGAP